MKKHKYHTDKVDQALKLAKVTTTLYGLCYGHNQSLLAVLIFKIFYKLDVISEEEINGLIQ